MTLAANLRAVVVERGLSPEGLARDCALDLATAQAALLGDGGSTLAHIDSLLACLDMSLDDPLVEHYLDRQAGLLGGCAQLEQYWALPADQCAQVDAFMCSADHSVGRSQSALGRAGRPTDSVRGGTPDGHEFLIRFRSRPRLEASVYVRSETRWRLRFLIPSVYGSGVSTAAILFSFGTDC